MDAIQQEDTTKYRRVFQLLDSDSNGVISQQELAVFIESVGLDTAAVQDIAEVNLQQFANLMATMQLKQPNYEQFFTPFVQDDKVHIAEVARALNKILGVSQGEIAQILGHLGIALNAEAGVAEFVNGLVRR